MKVFHPLRPPSTENKRGGEWELFDNNKTQKNNNICEQDFILDSCTQHHELRREQQAFLYVWEQTQFFFF